MFIFDAHFANTMFQTDVAKGKVASQLQQLFIIFLTFMLALVVGAFVLKSALSGRLRTMDRQLDSFSSPPALDSVLLSLNVAENNFQQACQHNDTEALAAYKDEMGQSLDRITQFARGLANNKNDTTGLGASFRQKMQMSQKLFALRQRFDSLMNRTTAASLGLLMDTGAPPPAPAPKLKEDSVVSLKSERSKAGFFRRMKDAFSNKTKVRVVTIRERPGGNPRQLSAAQQEALQAAVQQLKRQYSLIGASAQQLIAANLQLLSELRLLAEQARKTEDNRRQQLRNDLLKHYHETSDLMDNFTTAGFILLLVFTILLIYYVKKTVGAEHEYLRENERAVILAAQKGEILAIMSHEVRNKLTAINGAVYMLKRSELSPLQEQRVDSLGYASGLLLETVNNVLDVSKIEYGSAEMLKIQSFRPLAAVSEAVEAMRFSAEKNGLEVVTEMSGDMQQEFLGDALRLKQIVINLVGNAIKFTKAGRVTIAGDLQQKVLTVRISDTGSGISEAEQAKLFTRYYQGAKDGQKPGTGLGLYLCRQLVELQGGRISLTSQPGAGCTVEFSIPYPEA